MTREEENIIICAVRYAIGRMSYMVSVVCGYVESKCNELSTNCINIIIRDIEEGIEMYHRIGKTCGMECDEKEWLRLLEILNKRAMGKQW